MAYQPKSHRKFVATSMAAAMVATAAAPAAMAAEQAETSEATITFSDFGENHRAATEVFKLVEEGIIQGFPDGTFRPDASITRGAAALMLARGLGLVDADGVALEESDAEGFDDVSSADRVYDATRLLKEEDIIGGYADGTFRSDHTITRAEMAIILANAFDLERTSEEFSFTDRGAASQEAVQALYDNGITQGTAQEMIFGSDNEIIRSDFSVQLYRAMGFEEDEAPAALNVQSVVSVNSTTMEVTFEGELTEEDLEDMTFMFDPELEVTNVALKDAEVEAADEHMTTTVVLTTAEQEAGVTYQLTGVNGVALETPVTVEAAPLAVMNVAAVTEAYVTTVTADVTGAEDDAEATVEIFAFGDLDEDPAVTETVDVEDGMVEAEFANLPLGTHIAVVTVGEESDYTEFTIQLPVEEVSAINADYVTVAISAPEEDMFDQNVEVINSAGEVVEVEDLDIAAGDEVAEFEFVTTVDSDDLVGVWTVNGVEYDLDLFNNLSDFLSASNQLELSAALTALGIENVDSANMPEYFAEQQALTVTALELTLEDVQELVDDVNESAISAEEEEALVKAIVDAVDANNQITTLSALEDAGIAPLNSDWVAEYIAGTATPTPGLDTMTTANDLDDIQGIIDTLNDELVAANITTTGIDKEDLSDSKALIEAYATVNDDGDYVTAQFDTDIENIDIQLALVNVLDATTPTSFKNRLAALADLVDDTTQLDMDDYVDANGKAYIDALDATADGDKDTVAKVEGILFSYTTPGDAVDNVNLQEENALIAAVTSAADAEALIKALNDLGVKQVADTNEDAYLAYDSGSGTVDHEEVTSKAGAQTLVDAVNVAEVQSATASTIIAKLNVFGTDNVVADNAEDYVTDANIAGITADGTGDNDATVSAVETALDAANKAVTVDAQVKAINDAEDVAEVKLALDALADVDEAAGYLSVRSSDRDFVAAYVLEYRPTAGYGDETDIQAVIGLNDTSTFDPGDGSTVDASIKAHSDALDGINTLNFGSTVTEVVTALDAMLDEDFSALSNTEKANKAEEFHNALEFDENDDVTPQFRSLAEVKAVLWQ